MAFLLRQPRPASHVTMVTPRARCRREALVTASTSADSDPVQIEWTVRQVPCASGGALSSPAADRFVDHDSDRFRADRRLAQGSADQSNTALCGNPDARSVPLPSLVVLAVANVPNHIGDRARWHIAQWLECPIAKPLAHRSVGECLPRLPDEVREKHIVNRPVSHLQHRELRIRTDESQWIGVRSPEFRAISERIKVATRLSSKLSGY